MAGQRTRRQVSHPEWSDVRGLLHLKMKDAASELNTSTIYLQRLCRENGFPRWPGKKIRFMKATGMKFTLEEISEAKNIADKNMIRIQQAPFANHAPGQITTLNLIDKVGLLQSSNE